VSRLALSLSLLLATGIPATAQQGRFQITPGGPTLWVSIDTVSTPYTFAAPAKTVYRNLLEVYKTLKIPIQLDDSANGRMGHSGSALRDIGGRRMSTWLGCGVGMTGPYADTQRVIIAVVTQVRAMGADSSVIRTGVFANVFDVAQGSRTPKQCLTTGQLEMRIQTLVGERLAAGAQH
jgi:hypothetical protein